MCLSASLAACGAPPLAPLPEELAEPVPGYPAATSRLTLRLAGEYQKLCHATLVDASWALTAAHCFAGVAPTARGALNDFGRSLQVSEVVLHPGALRSGATLLEEVWATEDFIAAHDLAAIPLSPPVTDVAPAARVLPSEACAMPVALAVKGRFGQLGPGGRAQTAEANLLGLVAASSLLGPEHPGTLLSAQGPRVGPGDSGSGVSSDWAELELFAPGCATTDDFGEVLLGLIQDANIVEPSAPFGLTPLYLLDHASWLADTLELATAPAIPQPPRL